MKLNIYIGALVAMLAFTGCDEIKGTMSVPNGFHYLNKKRQAMQVPAGTFKSAIDLDRGDRELKISLKNAVNGKDAKMKLFIPNSVSIPTNYGSLNVRADQSGQPFDLRANVDTNVDQSQEIRTVESCTTTVYETVCQDVTDRDGRVRRVCRREPVTATGQQQVGYYYRRTTVSVDATIHHPQSQAVLARFEGDRTDSSKIYTYQGYCQVYGSYGDHHYPSRRW